MGTGGRRGRLLLLLLLLLLMVTEVIPPVRASRPPSSFPPSLPPSKAFINAFSIHPKLAAAISGLRPLTRGRRAGRRKGTVLPPPPSIAASSTSSQAWQINFLSPCDSFLRRVAQRDPSKGGKAGPRQAGLKSSRRARRAFRCILERRFWTERMRKGRRRGRWGRRREGPREG